MDAKDETAELERNRRRRVTIKNAEKAYGHLSEQYPPILSLKQASELSGYSQGTLKRHVSEGKYQHCVSKGKPLRFWRNKFVVELMR